MRGATALQEVLRRQYAISIHAPLAGCDVAKTTFSAPLFISIHAPLAGCDRRCNTFHSARLHFNPRTPCGVRLCFARYSKIFIPFQSTHPLRGATEQVLFDCQELFISIHAPLAGCDSVATYIPSSTLDFNPRTPCGVRRAACDMRYDILGFQSTHPLRGATSGSWQGIYHSQFQSTHPLRGATEELTAQRADLDISIHAPLAGCDSRPHRTNRRCYISIHAPLAGCDPRIPHHVREQRHFNPRTPCGVRPQTAEIIRRLGNFNPRTPCGVRLGAIFTRH